MIETSKVSFLVFYWSKTDDRERRFERLLFSHAVSILHNAHDREEYFFVFLVLLSILNDETLFKNTQDENISLVVRVALKKMRILLYYYYSYYY